MATFDTLIQNARIIDGSGNPWFYGDVAFDDGSMAQGKWSVQALSIFRAIQFCHS